MLNLVKYELIKKRKLILAAIAVSVILNIYLCSSYKDEGFVLFLSLFILVMPILYIVDVIKIYSDDINKKSGYLLFMTPNSGYKIIVSKLITAVIEGAAIILLFIIFTIVNSIYFSYISGYTINVREIIYVTNLMTKELGINFGHLLTFSLTAILALLGFFTTVYTSMTIRKSIFSEIKFNGALSFIIFLLLNWGIARLSNVVLDNSNFNSFMDPYTALEWFVELLPMNIFYAVQTAILTFCSGYLLENKINL